MSLFYQMTTQFYFKHLTSPEMLPPCMRLSSAVECVLSSFYFHQGFEYL